VKQQALPAKRAYNKQDGASELDYHGHLVHLWTHRDPSFCDWTGTAYIEFSENLVVHTVVLKPPAVFRSKQQASNFISRQARAWIDDRLSRAGLFKNHSVQLCETSTVNPSLVAKNSGPSVKSQAKGNRQIDP
jgi:hypothetical protein